MHVPRYAIGNAERSMMDGVKNGWLDALAVATNQPYFTNNSGGPTIKVTTY